MVEIGDEAKAIARDLGVDVFTAASVIRRLREAGVEPATLDWLTIGSEIRDFEDKLGAIRERLREEGISLPLTEAEQRREIGAGLEQETEQFRHALRGWCERFGGVVLARIANAPTAEDAVRRAPDVNPVEAAAIKTFMEEYQDRAGPEALVKALRDCAITDIEELTERLPPPAGARVREALIGGPVQPLPAPPAPPTPTPAPAVDLAALREGLLRELREQNAELLERVREEIRGSAALTPTGPSKELAQVRQDFAKGIEEVKRLVRAAPTAPGPAGPPRPEGRPPGRILKGLVDPLTGNTHTYDSLAWAEWKGRLLGRVIASEMFLQAEPQRRVEQYGWHVLGAFKMGLIPERLIQEFLNVTVQQLINMGYDTGR